MLYTQASSLKCSQYENPYLLKELSVQFLSYCYDYYEYLSSNDTAFAHFSIRIVPSLAQLEFVDDE